MNKGHEFVLLLSNDPNFFYFTKLHGSSFSGSFLVCERKNKKIIPKKVIVPILEFKLASSQFYDVEMYKDKKDLMEILKKILKGKRIFINYDSITISQFKFLKKLKFNFTDISKELKRIRSIKNKEEIEKIKKACKITNSIIKKLQRIIKVGKKEKEIAFEIEKLIKMHKHCDVAFPTIVASGENSSNPHYIAGDRRIKNGDVIIVDFGCKYKNYCSDVTRTFIAENNKVKDISKIKKMKAIKEELEKIKKCKEEILKKIREGIKIEEIQNIANRILGKMKHSILHSIGIEVHDPLISETLKENMVICIEPAIYNDFGIRIEDMVIVKKNGYELLTKS